MRRVCLKSKFLSMPILHGNNLGLKANGKGYFWQRYSKLMHVRGDIHPSLT